MREARGRYAPRPVEARGTAVHGAFTVKRYAILGPGRSLDAGLADAALERAARRLPGPADAVLGLDHHGLAVFVAHFGGLANWFLLDWWVGDSILRQHLLRSPLDAPAALEDVTGEGLVACVWEFGVLDFERRLWMETMLAPDGPDRGAYLSRFLSGSV